MLVALTLSVVVPVLIAVLVPRIIAFFGGDSRKYLPWLVGACLLYMISWWLPSPLILGQDTSFTTHFVGGGLFTGCLWYYLKRSLNWGSHWLLEAFSLFALVSALGVLNELFEIILYLFGAMPNGIADTSWDLLANTLGALVVYVFYAVTRDYGRRNR